MTGPSFDPITAALRQASGEEFEDTASIRRTGSKRSTHHGQLIVIGQQRGGRNLARSPSHRDVWRRIRRRHGVSLASDFLGWFRSFTYAAGRAFLHTSHECGSKRLNRCLFVALCGMTYARSSLTGRCALRQHLRHCKNGCYA